ncbi:hypothetical protein DSO57_1000643 [Entomophthora muscae]|uniref:Uncharacterized protein n=1 Tax=Entomophthora muscae TaxID=34485 RepID=A0ACC2S0F4_9FUNG|nr:hypothetical protein DSO57_1000643 [Entomophthora muscae]
MRLPKTSFMESLGYKWVYWMILLPAVLASILIGSHADSGTSPKAQFLDSSWRQIIPGVWYTATPLSHNPPCKEEPQNYQSIKKPVNPQVFCSLVSGFLLCYLGVYFFLGQFDPLLGWYCSFGEKFHLGMVSLPVSSLITGLNPSAIIHHLGRLLPSEWVPDSITGSSAFHSNSGSMYPLKGI